MYNIRCFRMPYDSRTASCFRFVREDSVALRLRARFLGKAERWVGLTRGSAKKRRSRVVFLQLTRLLACCTSAAPPHLQHTSPRSTFALQHVVRRTSHRPEDWSTRVEPVWRIHAFAAYRESSFRFYRLQSALHRTLLLCRKQRVLPLPPTPLFVIPWRRSRSLRSRGRVVQQMVQGSATDSINIHNRRGTRSLTLSPSSFVQAAVFIAIFSLSSLVYLYQIFRPKPKRMLWMLVFPICGLSKLGRDASRATPSAEADFSAFPRS